MSDPYARMSDSAKPTPERTVYVHRRPHRIVPGAFDFSLSDNAERDMAENRNFYSWAQMNTGGADLHSPLLDEVLIGARHFLWATTGGEIVTLDEERGEIAREHVTLCPHEKLNYDFMGGDICDACKAHF